MDMTPPPSEVVGVKRRLMLAQLAALQKGGRESFSQLMAYASVIAVLGANWLDESSGLVARFNDALGNSVWLDIVQIGAAIAAIGAIGLGVMQLRMVRADQIEQLQHQLEMLEDNRES